MNQRMIRGMLLLASAALAGCAQAERVADAPLAPPSADSLSPLGAQHERDTDCWKAWAKSCGPGPGLIDEVQSGLGLAATRFGVCALGLGQPLLQIALVPPELSIRLPERVRNAVPDFDE